MSHIFVSSRKGDIIHFYCLLYMNSEAECFCVSSSIYSIKTTNVSFSLSSRLRRFYTKKQTWRMFSCVVVNIKPILSYESYGCNNVMSPPSDVQMLTSTFAHKWRLYLKIIWTLMHSIVRAQERNSIRMKCGWTSLCTLLLRIMHTDLLCTQHNGWAGCKRCSKYI